MPAAAVIQEGRALFIVTWRLGYLGGLFYNRYEKLAGNVRMVRFMDQTRVYRRCGYFKRNTEMLLNLREHRRRRHIPN